MRAIVAALMKPYELTVKAPFTTPFATGVKTTVTVQLVPEARVATHEFPVRLNGDETAILRALRERYLCSRWLPSARHLARPRVASVNVICNGVMPIPDADWPMPLSSTCTGATPDVDEETVSVAVSAPAAAGVKMT